MGKVENAGFHSTVFVHNISSHLQGCWNSRLCGEALTHYQTTNFRLFQTERVCRQQFQIWRKWQKAIQMGRKHWGKGEIAHYEQFLLFPQCFQKACFPGVSKGVIVWEWVKEIRSRSLFIWVKMNWRWWAFLRFIFNPLPHNTAFWRTKDI